MHEREDFLDATPSQMRGASAASSNSNIQPTSEQTEVASESCSLPHCLPLGQAIRGAVDGFLQRRLVRSSHSRGDVRHAGACTRPKFDFHGNGGTVQSGTSAASPTVAPMLPKTKKRLSACPLGSSLTASTVARSKMLFLDGVVTPLLLVQSRVTAAGSRFHDRRPSSRSCLRVGVVVVRSSRRATGGTVQVPS